MRIAVTGASGFIGSAVARRLIADGHEVAVLVRPSSDLRRLAGGAALAITARLDEPESYQEALSAFAPRLGIHCAWDGILGGGRNDLIRQGTNYTAGLGFLAACREAGAKAWFGIGSQAEYGPCIARVSEDAPTVPNTAYGAVKLALLGTAHIVCAQAGMRFAWFRVFATYGPDDSPGFLVPSLILTLLDGRRPAMTAGTQVFDLLHVDDVGSALSHAALHSEVAGLYNLGSGEPRTVRSIAEDIRDAIDPALELGLGEIPMPPGPQLHLEADMRRLELAGWRPTIAWPDGLRQTIAWHRDNRGGQGPSCAS